MKLCDKKTIVVMLAEGAGIEAYSDDGITRVIFLTYYYFFFCAIECVCHSFAYVAHFVFLRDVWIRTTELP
jgi:hypothetical protein